METKRCFIENDLFVDENDMDAFEEFTGLKWDTAFVLIVKDAARLKPSTWNAIKYCDEIYMSTNFIGESFRLLKEMIDMAISNGIKHKSIINLVCRENVWNWIDKELEEQLKANGIFFIFLDDIK